MHTESLLYQDKTTRTDKNGGIVLERVTVYIHLLTRLCQHQQVYSRQQPLFEHLLKKLELKAAAVAKT